MALSFSDGAAHYVNLGSASSLDNLATCTYVMWIYRTGAVGGNNGRTLYNKGTFGSGAWFSFLLTPDTGSPANAPNFFVKLTTTSVNISGTALSLNTWYYIAATYDNSTKIGRLYQGSLTTTVSEVANATGAGAQGDDSAFNAWIARQDTTDNAPPARIATAMIFNRVLSLGELRTLQFQPRAISGSILYMQLGFNGTGTQPDWSGTGNSGVVTGATLTPDHAPLRPPFGFGLPWMGAYKAPGWGPLLSHKRSRVIQVV